MVKIAQGLKQLSFKDILDEVSEESILEFYTGISQVPCVTNSPLRVDNSPSFGLYYSSNGINYKDFSTGEEGSFIHLLEKLFQIPFKEVKIKIEKDISEIKKLDKYIIKHTKERYERQKESKITRTLKPLNVRIKEWEDYDIKFWKQFGINKEWLIFGNIYPIDYIFFGEDFIRAEKYAYCFVEFKDNISTLKIYQPFSKTRKWLNNHGSSVWDLWTQAINSESNNLIITSSRKDALSLWANTGIPSVSLQSEGYLPKPHVVEILQNKFSNIYCLYDNDYDKSVNHGRVYGKKLSDLYRFKQIEIPDIYKSKDPSDLFKNHGKEIFRKVIKSILI